MAVWHLIVLFSFTVPIGGAIGAARASEKGWSIYGLTILIGLLVGAIGAWASWSGFSAAQRRSQVQPFLPWQLRLVYAGGTVWVCVLGIAGFWLTRVLEFYV